MVSNKGNTVPNQFIITDEENRFFQSYDSIIAVIPFNKKKDLRNLPKEENNQTYYHRHILI